MVVTGSDVEDVNEDKTMHTLISAKDALVDITKIIDINRYSDLKKLYKITGWVLRFVNNLRRKINHGMFISDDCLMLDEFNHVKHVWLKVNQETLRGEINYKKLVMQLNLYEDVEGIIRSRGRVGNSKLPYDTKYPMLLNRNHN